MSADFGYINARVRGLKSRLLGPEFFTQALGDTDFRAFTSTLAQSPYGRELEEAQARDSGLAAVDRALARNFHHTTRSILNFSDGRPHDLIALLLREYDLRNLKAIARAKHAERSQEDVVEVLMPAGELKPAVLEMLAGQPDLPAVAQALAVTKHPLATAFSRAARRYAQDGDLREFELALDRAYYGSLLADAEALGAPDELVRHVRREIDATNLRTALKVRGSEAGSADLFVRGGKEISRATFDAIVNDPTQGALAALQGTSFARAAEAGTLGEAERAIRALVDESARRLAHGDPLGIGVVADFLRRKEAETARLRLLARGKFYSVPRDRLEKELQGA